jgi:vacuolar-type H+-ATPase subunit E/Vma4
MTMTDSYTTEPPSGFDSSSGGDASSGVREKVDTAKAQAGDLKDTAKAEAGNVAGTAKEEAANVASEAKSQAKDLFRQTQQELREQAATQQQRVATGLRSVSDELNGMASNAENQGVASDVVRQVAQRAGGVASWLDGRDPGSLLTEIKAFARRRPGVFIAGAAVAGVVAGRLTRALASEAKDHAADGSGATGATGASAAYGTGLTPPATTPVVDTTVPATTPVADPAFVAPATTSTSETPLYAERVTSYGSDPVSSDELDDGLGGTRGGQGL